MGITYEVCELGLFDLYTADEVMVTGTAAEICAITKIDGRMIEPAFLGRSTKNFLQHSRRRLRTPAMHTDPETIRYQSQSFYKSA